MTQQLLTIARGIVAKEYSLLVGAGASAGAIGGDGQALPTGPQLKTELIGRFELEQSAESAPLQRVFAAAAGADPQALATFLVQRFTQTTPTWQSRLAALPWQRVWTLNIDDVIERAFAEQNVPAAALTFRSSSARLQRRDDIEIVHLHGAAADLADRLAEMDATAALDAIIFDWPQYGRIVRNQPVWHQRFMDDFADTPFIAIGASIVDEIDFWQVFNRSSSALDIWGLPTVAVLRDVSDFDRMQLEKDMSISVSVSDGAAFIDELIDAYDNVLRNEANVTTREPTSDEQRFLSQFINLRQYNPVAKTSPDHFYDGWEPDWSTITSDTDVSFELTEHISREVNDAAASNHQNIFLLRGAPGTGKSTSLLRIGERARGAGLTPWLFRGDEALAPESLIQWARNHPRSIYLFDDCADFAGYIGDAADMASDIGVPLTVVATARENRYQYVASRFPSGILKADFPLPVGTLTNDDIRGLIRKLDSVGRLGRITRLADDARLRYFTLDHSGQLFSALAELEGGRGFVDRVVRMYGDLASDEERLLVSAVALAHHYGVTLRPSTASQLSGISTRDLVRLTQTDLAGILVGGRAGFRMSHRVTASFLLEHALDDQARFDVGSSVARAIGVHIDRAAIGQMSREHRLSRQILRYENVIWLVGQDRGRDFYEAVAPEYSWNGRFWDQRALFEMRLGDLARARSYAERSVDEHPHAYAFSTLGRVLMGVANQSGDLDELHDAIGSLDEARAASSRSRHWQPDEYPYTIFFTGLLAFASTHGFAALDSWVREAWAYWSSLARRSRIAGIHEQIRFWEDEWARLSRQRGD